ncbi:hypothetical protein A9O66_07585 [Paraburkholderia caribensis]|uniref:Uncharacterized protein n=1 Tax=Paraburkholderia caribensis TaxID=75105 RepID=A0A9Q6WKW5_9BURK|nr:hypothetical protein A9O66_07585 [Paraburkholderia caribensis]
MCNDGAHLLKREARTLDDLPDCLLEVHAARVRMCGVCRIARNCTGQHTYVIWTRGNGAWLEHDCYSTFPYKHASRA